MAYNLKDSEHIEFECDDTNKNHIKSGGCPLGSDSSFCICNSFIFVFLVKTLGQTRHLFLSGNILTLCMS